MDPKNATNHDETSQDKPHGLMPAVISPASRMLRTALASAVFLTGAIALVDPALAGQCDDTMSLIRDAADSEDVSGDSLRRLDRSIDNAVLRLNLGDIEGCLSELAGLRETLKIG